MKDKVLIAVAYWPTKSGCFFEFTKGLESGIGKKNPIDYELFIHSSIADNKFESIVNSLSMAREYALSDGSFTHMLGLDADVKLKANAIRKLVVLKKEVVVSVHSGRVDDFQEGQANYDSLVSSQIGWACMLANMKTIEKVPFTMSGGEYLYPDRMYFKRLIQLDIPVYIDTITQPILLEESTAKKDESK